MNMLRNAYFAGLGLVIVLLTGCGGDTSNELSPVYPVKGKIVVGGRPAAGVHVFLVPVGGTTPSNAAMNPHGTTDTNGSFAITTYAENDGAPEGSYQVLLNWPPVTKDGEESDDSERFFGWHDMYHSKLTAKVKTGSNELPTFNLPIVTGPPPKVEGVPGRN